MSVAHSSNEYMRAFRKKQRCQAAQKDEWINESLDLMEDFIRERVKEGLSPELAEAQFYDLTTPPQGTQPLEASDSVPETRPDCFGKEFHKDSECACSLSVACHKAWVAELFKPPAVKEAERKRRILDCLEKGKALLGGIERREHLELLAEVQVQKDAEQKEFDAAVKRYTDQGIPEKIAIESATWEQKQRQDAIAREFRENWRKRSLMTDEEKTAEKLKILRDNKKLRGDSE